MFNRRAFLGYIVSFFVFSTVSFAKEILICSDNVIVSSKSSSSASSVNINTASFEELSAKLKGIGKAKAAAIIEWRENNGKFMSLEDVDEVRGIGPAILEKNKALIRFED